MPRQLCSARHCSDAGNIIRKLEPSRSPIDQGTVAKAVHSCLRRGVFGGGSHAFHPVVPDRNPDPHHPPAGALHTSLLRRQLCAHSLVRSSMLSSRSSASTLFVSS